MDALISNIVKISPWACEVKHEQPLNLLKVQVWLLYYNQNFNYYFVHFIYKVWWNYGQMDKQTDRWSDN